MFKHILVPTDGSERSHNTIRRAVSFAKETGAKITVFHAKPDFHLRYYGEGYPIDFLPKEEFEQRMEKRTQEILSFAEDQCREAGVPCMKMSLTNNTPYEAILEAATQCGCDLIFMAAYGHSEIASLLLGSETQKVLVYSTIPVLVHRSPE